IDEVSVYNSFLSTADMEAIYAAGRAGKYSPSPAPAPAEMIGSWKGENDCLDSVSGREAIERGRVSYVPGVVGQAFSFAGTNSYIEMPDCPSLNPTNAITVECWINHQSRLVDFESLIRKVGFGSDDSGGYAMEFLGDDIQFFIHCNGAWKSSGDVFV